MTLVKTQITQEGHLPIAPEVLAQAYLQAGDEVVIQPVTRGVFLVKALSLVEETTLLAHLQEKISHLQQHLGDATGLTAGELFWAIQYHLIPEEQAYWWSESWQVGEREVEHAKQTGQVMTFETVDSLLAELQTPDEAIF